jgi:hypothetical protein
LIHSFHRVSAPRIGAYVIAGQAAGISDGKPRADLNRPWCAIVQRAGQTGLRIHDLRHTQCTRISTPTRFVTLRSTLAAGLRRQWGT